MASPFITWPLDGGEWSTSRFSPFTPEEQPPVPTGWEAGWAPESSWPLWRRIKSLAPAGNPIRIP
jgi:hypothetical protein